MLRIILNCPTFFRSPARYVFETWLTYYRIPFCLDEDAYSSSQDALFTIYYGDPESAGRTLLASSGGLLIPFHPATLIHFHERRNFDLQSIIHADGVPYLFACLSVETHTEWQRLPVDPIASAFFFLSAFQEYVADAIDNHGRFASELMLQKQLGVEAVPLVDKYFQALVGYLPPEMQVNPVPLPQNAPFAVCLSHDIDYLFLGHAGNLLRQLVEAAAYTGLWLGQKANHRHVMNALKGFVAYPYLNLDTISEMERGAGVSATYNFIPVYGVPEPGLPTGKWRYLQWLLSPYVYRRLRHRVVNADYHLTDPRVQRLLHWLNEQGAEIGLHTSYEAVPDHRLQEEIASLKQYVGELTGMRSHYLHFRTHDLYQQLEDTSLVYDHSLIAPHFSGYRTGTARPHLIFDHEHNRPFSTLSIPLHYMDAQHIPNLLGTEKDVEAAWETLKSMLEGTRERQTLLTVLTHNWLFSDPDTRRLYEYLLAYIQEHGGIGLTARAVYEWWAQYNQVRL